MALDNTPRVSATILDGSLKDTVFSTQPKLLFLAPASSGESYEVFRVGNTGEAEVEFGSDTELCKAMHEAVAQGSDNVSLMRIGGTRGTFVFTDSGSNTLTITPESTGDETLSRYALFMATVDSANRILLYDLDEDGWIYDSSEILCLNGDQISVVDTGIDLFTVGDISLPSEGIALADLVTGDFTVAGTRTATSAVATAGTDGTNMSLVEKYAALNTGYMQLDFLDADYVAPKGVFIDDANVADGDTCNFFFGVPAAGETNDTLGYVWEYMHQGKKYTYFVDRSDYFTAEGSPVAATRTVNTDLVITADKTGTGGNSISIQISTAGPTGPSCTISRPTNTSLKILVTGTTGDTTSEAVTVINTALAAYTLPNGRLASEFVTASGGGATALTTVANTSLTSGAGGHVLTHEDLTGEAIPAAVSDRFDSGVDAELREVNFAHQLASFCARASTTWKTIQGAISVKSPTDFSRRGIAEWVGSPPTISSIGNELGIAAVADNGTGLFSIKIMAGKAISSNGYRAALLEDGDATDGYLYGGIIKTKGLSLPSQDTQYAYGIDDGDEDADSGGAPIDIGKHIFVTIDWPIHRNSYNGGVNYRGSIEVSTIAILAQMPENLEPIGRDYPLKKITGVPRISAAQRDDLTKFRFCNLRLEPSAGYVYNSVRTAAHKTDSDYTRGSTIRCVNRELSGIRNICKNYIGKPFISSRIINLQSDVDSFLLAEKALGFNDGAKASISYTRSDKILGKMTVRVKMVPPFTIEVIDVEMSLAAEASELG